MIDRDSLKIPSVTTIFKKSTDCLDKHLRDCFCRLGVFRAKPATFDIEAVKAILRTKDFKRVIRSLVNRGLIEPIGNGRFQIHSLVAAHARNLREIRKEDSQD